MVALIVLNVALIDNKNINYQIFTSFVSYLCLSLFLDILPMQFWIVPDPLQDDRRLALGSDIRLICNAKAKPTDELVYKWFKQVTI